MAEEENQESSVTFKPVFKKKQNKNLRTKRIHVDSEDDEEDTNETLNKIEEMKDLQKLRQRPNGISVVGLALGKKVRIEEEMTTSDPFKVNSGGMVNMQNLKTNKSDSTYDTDIGTQFSAETNIRDQDEEMMKYIEDQLREKKGGDKPSQNSKQDSNKQYLTPEEAALFALPTHLKQTSSQKSEEMLSNQMLNGIPEVDLGIDVKIKNIEATEEAKQKMIQDQKKKNDGPSFVPVNMAANFTTHINRYSHNKGNNHTNQEKRDHVHKNNKQESKKATDDFYFDKFRNKFRKH